MAKLAQDESLKTDISKTVETVELLSWLLSSSRLNSWVTEIKKSFPNRFNGFQLKSVNLSKLIRS